MTNPSEIFVLAGCVSAVVGATASFLCNKMLENHKAKLKREGDLADLVTQGDLNKQLELSKLVTQGDLDKQLDLMRGAAAAMASGYIASQERRLQAIDGVWSNILAIRQFAAPITYVYDVYPPG